MMALNRTIVDYKFLRSIKHGCCLSLEMVCNDALSRFIDRQQFCETTVRRTRKMRKLRYTRGMMRQELCHTKGPQNLEITWGHKIWRLPFTFCLFAENLVSSHANNGTEGNSLIFIVFILNSSFLALKWTFSHVHRALDLCHVWSPQNPLWNWTALVVDEADRHSNDVPVQSLSPHVEISAHWSLFVSILHFCLARYCVIDYQSSENYKTDFRCAMYTIITFRNIDKLGIVFRATTRSTSKVTRWVWRGNETFERTQRPVVISLDSLYYSLWDFLLTTFIRSPSNRL